MPFSRYLVCATAMILAACNAPAGNEQQVKDVPSPVEAQEIDNHESGNDRASAEDRKALVEPHGPIDPKSVEAAGQVVQSYGALIEQKRWAEAAKLWGESKAAADFASALRDGMHLEIGELGGTEGAAGSIYTTVPVTFYDESSRRPAQIILRRVNDVPGSTETQRRWHIERIEWVAP